MRSMMKWGGVAVLIGAASLSLAWAEPQDRSPRTVTHRWVQQFGMVTPANGQTLRLHVVNLGLKLPPDPITPEADLPPDPIVPPDPCRVVLAFYNSAGHLIGTPNFKTLEGGQAAFIDLGFSTPTENGFPPDPCRAAVWVLQTVRRGESPPDPC